MKPVIICVDDEKLVLSSLEQQINNWFAKKYDCELAQGGEEAILLVNELLNDNKRIALIISDQIMPGMRGDELLVFLHQKLPQVPKILLTGQASIPDIQNAISNARLYRYVQKPWVEHDLMLTLEDALLSYNRQVQLLEHNRLLRSLAKATQMISGEINYSTLCKLLVENAVQTIGAKEGYLAILKNNQWFIASAFAIDRQKNYTLQGLVQEKNLQLLQTILQRIREVQNPNHPSRLYRVIARITRKNKSLGFLFLELKEADPALYESQLEVLQMLASQGAISLENAELYQRLAEQTLELQKEKEKVEQINMIIEEKNKGITDSIRYARRIQEAIMPDKAFLQQYFPNSFVLYQPKDIVSGDFFWWLEKGTTFIIAAVDCTGHGVPGAFMSVIGSNFLNQIINEYGITEPDAILQYLNHRVRLALKQDIYGDEELLGNDGMELALCAYDSQTRTLKFAGANRPLYVVHREQLLELPPTKIPIGGRKKNESEPVFQLHTMEVQTGDTIYICTDGIADQFGGPEQKRFSTKRLKDMLLSIQELSFPEQAQTISQTVEHWRGQKEEQIDDILIIGIRFD
jgi:serine phosphatase RsbU (regulator of sigma subunit)/FixJ family two-component response regulator